MFSTPVRGSDTPATLLASRRDPFHGDDAADGCDVRALVADGVFHSTSSAMAQPRHMLRRRGTVQSAHISLLQREQ